MADWGEKLKESDLEPAGIDLNNKDMMKLVFNDLGIAEDYRMQTKLRAFIIRLQQQQKNKTNNSNAKMPTEEESKWEEVAKAYDDGKGLPLEGVNPDDKETMNEVYGALKVNNIGAKARLRRFIRSLREPKETASQPKKQKQGPDLKQFDPTIKKKPIETGQVAAQLGGLLDRNYSIECLFKNLQLLATKRGNRRLDKKDVPLLAVAAPSESGKTEFMKWVNNHCCTDLNPDVDGNAMNLLSTINDASPDGQEKFKHVLVLFASFNQTSSYHYQTEKGMIVETTIERLLRSHQGLLDMSKESTIGPAYNTQHFRDFTAFGDIATAFENDSEKGNTAFIFCIDELSKFHEAGSENEGCYADYKHLLDELLTFSHVRLREGGYCAIVVSALTMVDVGGYVVQRSGRALAPIYFRDRKPTIRKKAMELFLQKSCVSDCAEAEKKKELLICAVRTAILESYTSIYTWRSVLNVDKTTRRMKIEKRVYGIPKGIGLEDVFELCSRTLFNTSKSEKMDETRLKGIVDELHGGVQFANEEEQISVTTWDNLSVLYSLPAHRLLQILPMKEKEFQHVHSWAISSVYKLYYDIESIDEIVKAWELATIALLDLRRAMLYVAKDKNPLKLNQMFLSLDRPTANTMFVHQNLEQNMLDAVGSNEAAKEIQLSSLPGVDDIYDSPTVITSERSNEEGVEGVFQNAFSSENGDPIHVFFQMKLYTIASQKQICDWLSKVEERASALGYHPETCIIQLFVTGAVEDNIEKQIEKWPKNSMVFGTAALKHLFEPFGDGFIVEIINQRTRKSDLEST